jgi:hypothetical protein
MIFYDVTEYARRPVYGGANAILENIIHHYYKKSPERKLFVVIGSFRMYIFSASELLTIRNKMTYSGEQIVRFSFILHIISQLGFDKFRIVLFTFIRGIKFRFLALRIHVHHIPYRHFPKYSKYIVVNLPSFQLQRSLQRLKIRRGLSLFIFMHDFIPLKLNDSVSISLQRDLRKLLKSSKVSFTPIFLTSQIAEEWNLYSNLEDASLPIITPPPGVSFEGNLKLFPCSINCASCAIHVNNLDILVIGDLLPRKNYLQGLTILNDFAKSFDMQLKINIVYSNSTLLLKLKNLVSRFTSIEVTLYNRICSSKLFEMLKECKILVNFSRDEGFCFPVYDACILGKVVVSPWVPSLSTLENDSLAKIFIADGDMPSDWFSLLHLALASSSIIRNDRELTSVYSLKNDSRWPIFIQSIENSF